MFHLYIRRQQLSLLLLLLLSWHHHLTYYPIEVLVQGGAVQRVNNFRLLID
jgi:hypothetical protein